MATKKDKKLLSDIKKLIERYKLQIDYAKEFTILVLVYGLLLDGSLSTIMPGIFKFSIRYIIALGVLFYFLKEELPSILKK